MDRRERREARDHAAAGALGDRLARAAIRADTCRGGRHAAHGRGGGHRQDGGRARALSALLGARGLARETRGRCRGARRVPPAAGAGGTDRAGVARAARARRAAGARLRPLRRRSPPARRSHRGAPSARERGDGAGPPRRGAPRVTRRWRESPATVLGVLTGLNALNYLDRYVGAATLPLMLASLSISDAAGGLLQSAFILTYALVCPFIGWAGDRGPRMRLAAAGVFLWSVATVASGLAPTYALLLLARAIVGVGEASYAVVTPSLLSDCYPPERRARVLGIFYAAIPVGSALGYVVGGLVGEHFGWRAAFFVAGAPGMVLAFVLLLLVEPRRGARDAAGAGAVTPLSLGASLRALVARRSWVSNTAAQVIYTFAMGGLATWMPTYFVRERGIPLATAASTFGLILVAAGFIGTLIGGRLSDALTRRVPGAHFVLSGWSLVASIAFTLPAVLAPSPAVFWPATFVTLLLLFMNIGPLNAAMANVLPADLRARGFAVTTGVMHLLGDAASPWLIGVASDAVGLTAPVLVTGCLLVVAGIVLLLDRASLVRDMRAVVGSGDDRAPAVMHG
ncbi:MAG: MFS transporter [Candidatus Rokuibacteriota bacterium]|nr:MAG: MFS transporter [Candidatus Rokubacteria bacterium]